MKTQATSTLPRAARQALIKLGGDIAVARKKTPNLDSLDGRTRVYQSWHAIQT